MSRDSNTYTFFFAAVICLISSIALTFVSKGLEGRKALNIEIDRQKNVLKAFGFDVSTMKGKEIQSKYTSTIEEIVVDIKGQVIPGKKPTEIKEAEAKEMLAVFKAKDETGLLGYAIPVKGYGLWSWLYGYFALDKDLNTVKGITFYKHGETPGLGGEIEAPWFQQNFIGKKIYDQNGNLTSITVLKGKVDETIQDETKKKHSVDGISGATITSRGVTDMLSKDLKSYQPYFNMLKGGK